MNHRVSPKAGARRTHAERSAATRQHLIATAIDVIQHRSLEEMSIHELAKSAGMTSGAVQHHFESKAVLMMNVLSELIESTVRSGELWPSPALPARDRAAKFVQAVWSLVYAQPRFIVAWNIYLGCRNQPEVLGHIAELRQSVQTRMHEGFFTAFPELACGAGCCRRCAGWGCCSCLRQHSQLRPMPSIRRSWPAWPTGSPPGARPLQPLRPRP